MVFITIGNQNFQFERLLRAVEFSIKENYLQGEVVVQSGHTEFESSMMKVIPFLGKSEFEKHIIQSDFIISHAGTGSIINGLRNKKKMIVAARQSKYNEHIDDHQAEILSAFSNLNYIIPLNSDISDLNVKLSIINDVRLNPYVSNTENFNKSLISIINSI